MFKAQAMRFEDPGSLAEQEKAWIINSCLSTYDHRFYQRGSIMPGSYNLLFRQRLHTFVLHVLQELTNLR